MNKTDKRLQKALDDVLDVEFIGNTFGKAVDAHEEVDTIIRTLHCDLSADLRQLVAQVMALVPEVEFLELAETALTEWAAYLENYEDDEHEIRTYWAYAQDAHTLAARIRNWRER